MKKLLRFTILFIIMMGWIYGFTTYVGYFSLDQQMVAVMLIFAPITEEILFREVGYQFGKRFNAMAFTQIFSSMIFGLLHADHFFAFGQQYSMAVQGMFGIILFQVRKETNLFWCMVMHSAWNATILLIF